MAVEIQKMLHLGKEIRIGNLQKVLCQMWLKIVLSQDSMNAGTTDGNTKHVRVCHEMPFSPPYCPAATPGQRKCLPIKIDETQLNFIRKNGGVTGACLVVKTSFHPTAYPAINRTEGTTGKFCNYRFLYPGVVKRDNL